MVPGTQAPDPQAESQKATDPTMSALMQILQQSNRARVQQQPPAVPSGQSPTPQAPQRRRGSPGEFLSAIGTSLSGIAKVQQQRQLAQATNLYSSYMTTLDKYVKPDGSIDMQKALQDPFIQSIKPADLKKMSKALAAPWLDPGKTTVETQALAAVAKKRQAQQQARQGLDKLFHGLVQKATAKPQLSPEQQQAQKSEVIARTPTTGADTKEATGIAESIAKIQQARDSLDLRADQLDEKTKSDLANINEKYEALKQKTTSDNAKAAKDLADLNEKYAALKQKADADAARNTAALGRNKIEQQKADTAASKSTQKSTQNNPAKATTAAQAKYEASQKAYQTWESKMGMLAKGERMFGGAKNPMQQNFVDNSVSYAQAIAAKSGKSTVLMINPANGKPLEIPINKVQDAAARGASIAPGQ